MDERTKQRYRRNIQRIANGTVGKIDNSYDFSFYDSVYQKAFCDFEETETSYIGTYCVMIPDELIYALGYTPLRMCAGHQISALVGEELVPRDACPLIKATAGFQSMQVLPMYNQCELAIMPMTCEAKRKSVEVLSRHLPVIPVPVSMSKDNGSFEDTVSMLIGLMKTLEIQTGNKITAKKLKQACLNVNAAQKQAYLLQRKLYEKNPSIKGSQVIYAMNSFIYTDPLEWEMSTRKLLAEIDEKEVKEPKRQKPRVFIAGSPISFPNYKVPFMIEELGAQIVGDESCLSGRLLYDPVVPMDFSKTSVIRALAARYIAACTCPVFDNIEDRLASLKTRLDESGAEGIIYHVLRGCVPYDFELAAVEKWAEKENVPILRVETDFSSEDVEQIKIRFEAFVEMIDQRRKNRS